MAKAPAFQFYIRDWLTDTELGQCRPATRGVWIDLVALMWVAPEQGQITGTEESLARLCRCTPDELVDALAELDATMTASVTRDGEVTPGARIVTVACRRMRREATDRKAHARRQKRYREKLDGTGDGNSDGDVTVPFASAVSAAASAKQKDLTKKRTPKKPSPSSNSCPYSDIAAAWNELASAHGLSTIRTPITAKRKEKLAARWRESDFRKNWQAALEAIPKSRFLLGKTDRGGWRVNFDFVIHDDLNWQKIVEGQYADGDDRAGSSPMDSENNYAALLAAQPEGANS